MEFWDNFYCAVIRNCRTRPFWRRSIEFLASVNLLWRNRSGGAGESDMRESRHEYFFLNHLIWILHHHHHLLPFPSARLNIIETLWEKDEKWFFPSIWRWLMIRQNKFLLSLVLERWSGVKKGRRVEQFACCDCVRTKQGRNEETMLSEDYQRTVKWRRL